MTDIGKKTLAMSTPSETECAGLSLAPVLFNPGRSIRTNPDLQLSFSLGKKTIFIW